MPKLDLVARWDTAVASFKTMTKDDDFGPVFDKVLKIEYIEHKKLLQDVEAATQMNKPEALDKAQAAYAKAARFLSTTLAKLQAKHDNKEVKTAVKKMTGVIDDLRGTCNDLAAKTIKVVEPPAKTKIEWKSVFTPDLVARMTKLTMESSDYKGFVGDFGNFVKECGLGSNAQKIPAEIWAVLLRDLAKSGDLEELFNHVTAKPEEAVLAEMTKSPGKQVCKAVSKVASAGLQPFAEHASRYLDKVIRETQKGSKWVFWSGTGAREAAAKEGGGVVLDETIGRWFDEMCEFGDVSLRKNRELWADLSELYVKRAAQCYQRFRFIGFVGPGATRDQGAFGKLEKATVLTALSAKASVPAPPISWLVVDCEQDGAKWRWSKRASIPVSSRSAALTEIKARYGG